MLSIGEFSRICFVSKKTLRYYDDIGLLRPEYTAENGYRYYTVNQLRTMLLISRLKSYGFSLPEIAATLANPNEDILAGKLREKHSLMEMQMQNTKHILSQIQEDINKLNRSIDIMEQNIIVKTIELNSQPIFGIRKKINIKEFPDFIGSLFEEAAKNNINTSGPPLVFYHDEEFNSENADVEVAIAVANPKAQTREFAGGLHCVSTILGAYKPEVFTATYASMVKWIEENGYIITGSPFDKYVRGGKDYKPDEYITEIYFPIKSK